MKIHRSVRSRLWVLSCPLIVACLVRSAPAADKVAEASAAKSLVVFVAMGDVPYAPAEDVLLPQQIADFPQDAEFAIHLGDIKTGATACSEDVYVKVAGMLGKSRVPLFIIPGDNEYNDCLNPAEGWKFWNKHFLRFEQRWPHTLRVFRQLEREENFAFPHGGVLFVGLNLVGGRVHDKAEWKRRHAEDLDWLRRNIQTFGDASSSLVVFGHALPTPLHDDFFRPFIEEAGRFDKPVLYLHGDGHRWIHDRPFSAKNILRVQVDQGGIAPPIKVTVNDSATEPFVIDRRKPGPP